MFTSASVILFFCLFIRLVFVICLCIIIDLKKKEERCINLLSLGRYSNRVNVDSLAQVKASERPFLSQAQITYQSSTFPLKRILPSIAFP